MIIPIRCFTCGKVVGNLWEPYIALLQAEYSEGQVSFFLVGYGQDTVLRTGPNYEKASNTELRSICPLMLEAFVRLRDALDALGLKRFCCRRMLLSHVNLVEKLVGYHVPRKHL
ncbi:hypothetical protein M514_03660 [Trichuris suis]|uniref:DNA-directed RNA polymerases I, II, and III subunit RPABC5 n=1 Tax=Trichuris suis TaxID=68888 RepID=A0A085NGP3_9BILA|nr:hypothetical protein M513_03660 [Trichuris suis]KFD68639.1 hypothetical protein M514_03660 [Trichuris suis]